MSKEKEGKKNNHTISGLKKIGMAILTVAAVVVPAMLSDKNKNK